MQTTFACFSGLRPTACALRFAYCAKMIAMAIYHLSVKPISRSAGRSATASAAYRSGVEIVDERSGEVHDYTRRSGVESVEITLPSNAPDWAKDRSKLWNAVEKSEIRKNSTVAREFEVSLPDGLNSEQRRQLVREFATELATRHGVAVDAAIHTPGKEGDNRNHHAHVLTSTRRLGPDGFGEKARELDSQITGPKEVEHWRERWGTLTNKALERAGQEARVDHRSLVAQRIEALALGDLARADVLDREPTRHLGPMPTDDLRQYERKKKPEVQTDRAREHLKIKAENAERQSLLQRLREVGEVVRNRIEWGIEQASKRFDAITAGMENAREQAKKWAEKQLELTRTRELELAMATSKRGLDPQKQRSAGEILLERIRGNALERAIERPEPNNEPNGRNGPGHSR